jgi:CheY-like chemotaxis protein
MNTKKRKKIKLLIVEDSALVQMMLKEMLKQFKNCIADFAEDGKTALALFNAEYDLILMDIDLPDIDGMTVTSTIRKIEKKHHVPIVAITAHFDEKEYQEKFELVGMNGFSGKPDMVTLQNLIQQYVFSTCTGELAEAYALKQLGF